MVLKVRNTDAAEVNQQIKSSFKNVDVDSFRMNQSEYTIHKIKDKGKDSYFFLCSLIHFANKHGYSSTDIIIL